MAKKSQDWSSAAQVDLIPLEPEQLYMFRSTLVGAGGYSDSYAYFLIRPGGNCLFHGPNRADFYREQRGFFDAHGGIALQVCSHAGDVSDAWSLSHLIEPRARSWVFALHPMLKDAGLRTLETLRGLEVDFLLPLRIQAKGDLAQGPRAPLPFGKAVREKAVDQATRAVQRKLRQREAKAKAKSAT